MGGRIQRPTENTGVGLPRIGKIKTGMKKGNFPTSVDYFIPSGKYEQHFKDAFGERPNKIEIVFINNDPEVSCSERYELRDNEGRLYASGDGNEFKVWNPARVVVGTTQTGAYDTFSISEHPDLMEKVLYKSQSKTGWKVTLTLRFVIPKIATIAGYWEYVTKGDKSSIPNIRNSFDHMLENSRNGSIIGLPFDLNVEFAKSNKPGIKSRYPVVSMVANMSEQNLEMMKACITKLEHKQLGA